jgi:hypothetical protein
VDDDDSKSMPSYKKTNVYLYTRFVPIKHALCTYCTHDKYKRCTWIMVGRKKKKRKAEPMCNAFGAAVQWWSLTVAIVLR